MKIINIKYSVLIFLIFSVFSLNAQTFTYLNEFGGTGTGNGQFDSPNGMAIASNGNILVADGLNHRIQIFDNTGNYLSEFGTMGTGNGQFNRPARITIAANGDILVTDSQNDRVQRFNNVGVYQSEFGSNGTGNGQFDSPNQIVIAPNGDILVTDFNNDRVQHFDNAGNYINEFGGTGSGNGQFMGPTGVEITANGDVLIADFNNDRVQRFSGFIIPLIPTMGEWGLIILALLVLSIGTLFVMQPSLQTTNGQNLNLPFSQFTNWQIPFDKSTFLKIWVGTIAGLALIFSISTSFFGYEMTNADLPMSILVSGVFAFLVQLLIIGEKLKMKFHNN